MLEYWNYGLLFEINLMMMMMLTQLPTFYSYLRGIITPFLPSSPFPSHFPAPLSSHKPRQLRSKAAFQKKVVWGDMTKAVNAF